MWSTEAGDRESLIRSSPGHTNSSADSTDHSVQQHDSKRNAATPEVFIISGLVAPKRPIKEI